MTNFDGLLRAWTDELAAGGARPQTIALRRWQLKRLDNDHPGRHVLTLGPADLAAWLRGQGWGPETLRSYRSAVRSFYSWAVDAGHLDLDPARRLRPVRPTTPVPRAAADPVIDAAIARATPRVELMLMLASRCGLRRGEIAAVHSDDVEPDLTGWSLRVNGKGGKVRVVPMPDNVAATVRGAPAGWLFPNGLGGHLTPAHAGKLMRRTLQTATAHQLRHRYATVIYRRTGRVEAVRQLLGHASLVTTQRYIAVDQAELRAVAEAAA
jgi:integrase/recombinase XerC